MLVFRSLAIGLLGACVLLLAQNPPRVQVIAHLPAAAASIATPPVHAEPTLPVSIVDATCLGCDLGRPILPLSSLVRLAPGEVIVEAPEAWASGRVTAGDYVDLEVEGPAGRRRVLLLLH